MKLTIGSNFSTDLKIQFINEAIVLYEIETIKTSTQVSNDAINIITNDHEELKYILDSIQTGNVKIEINSVEDIVIILIL